MSSSNISTNSHINILQLSDFEDDELISSTFGILSLNNLNSLRDGEQFYQNQSTLLNIDKSVTEELLIRALGELTGNHTSLAFLYGKKTGTQSTLSSDAFSIESTQISTLPELLGIMQSRLIEEHLRNINTKKELLHILLIKTPQVKSNSLLIVLNHIEIDDFSWKILIHDLNSILIQCISDKEIKIPIRNKTYMDWYDRFMDYGKSENLNTQLEHWGHVSRSHRPLPVDVEYSGDTSVENRTHIVIRLGYFPAEKPGKIEEINELVLIALAKTLIQWSGSNHISIGLQANGRQLFKEIDTTGIIGSFSNIFPFLIENLEGTNEVGFENRIKHNLRNIPDFGIGFDIIKHNYKENGTLKSAPWNILFNCLSPSNYTLVDEIPEIPAAHLASKVAHDIFIINLETVGHELALKWNYSNKHFKKETIALLADLTIKNLNSLLKR